MSANDDVSARDDLRSQGDLDLPDEDLERGPDENLLQTDNEHQTTRSDRSNSESPEKEGCFSCCRKEKDSNVTSTTIFSRVTWGPLTSVLMACRRMIKNGTGEWCDLLTPYLYTYMS